MRWRRGWDRARGRQRPRRPGPGPRSSPGQTKVAAAGRGRPQPRTPGGGLAWPRSPLPSRATVAVRRGRDRLRGRDAVAAVAAVAVVGAVAVFTLLAGVVATAVALGGATAALEARALWSPPVAGRVRVRRRSRRGLARAIRASCRRGPGAATAAEVVTEGGARRRGRGRGGHARPWRRAREWDRARGRQRPQPPGDWAKVVIGQTRVAAAGRGRGRVGFARPAVVVAARSGRGPSSSRLPRLGTPLRLSASLGVSMGRRGARQ